MGMATLLGHFRRFTMGHRLRAAIQRNRDAALRLDRAVKEMIER